jgi:chemotaxis protein MotB
MVKKKKKSDAGEVANGWVVTWSDLVSLLLCFFVILFNPEESDSAQLAALASFFRGEGIGANVGGNTLSVGKNADLGNTIMSLPSMDRGKSLGTALKRAASLFQSEIRSNKAKVTSDERGLVISLASDTLFRPASARINIEQTRDTLLNLGTLLQSEEVRDRKIRIEGHTDDVPLDPDSPWESNWQLSSMRSINVLRYLTDIGVNEKRFQVAGFADTAPVSRNDTAEGRAYNRRVDIIILEDAHL